MSYFSDLGLAEPILRALGAKGYSEPTPIQRQAIPALLEGRDLLGIAQTGTGKTAAFSLPSLHRLAANPTGRHPAGCRMLVLSPTRELAAQIADNLQGYARFLNLSVQCVFGGLPVGKQAKKLVPGCDILVATPGRLLDLIDQRALTLRHVEIFVLDEADQMMDLGFIKPLTRIAGMLPKERQSLFFSATMPDAIAKLGKQFITDPVRVEVAPQATTAERVDQFATFIDQKEKQALLTLSLRKGLANGEIDRCLVFTRTKHGADRVVRHLVAAGITSAAIHGNKTQAQRTRALDGFRAGTVPVLVATDIAARGIDVPEVSAVFNFELPNVAEQYVHRIGRTARAGRSGMAISYVARDEKAYLRDIEKLTGVKLTPAPIPGDFVQQAASLPAPSRKPAGAERAPSDPADRPQRNRRSRAGADGPKRIRAQIEARPRGDSNRRDDTRRDDTRRDDKRRDGQHRDSARRDDRRREGGNRDDARREFGNRGESRRDNVRGEDSRREGGRRDDQRRDFKRPESNRRDDTRREGGNRDDGRREFARRDDGRREGSSGNHRPKNFRNRDRQAAR